MGNKLTQLERLPETDTERTRRIWFFESFSVTALKCGEPGRTRTYNPLIKSQLLYH